MKVTPYNVDVDAIRVTPVKRVKNATLCGNNRHSAAVASQASYEIVKPVIEIL